MTKETKDLLTFIVIMTLCYSGVFITGVQIMSKSAERVKYLKEHGATGKEARMLVMAEQEKEIERLELELEESRETTQFIRSVVI